MDNIITVSIIGSASSKGNIQWENLLNKKTWEKLCQQAEDYISSHISNQWSNIHLISGGAAWCDHIAIYLYLKHLDSHLTLHFPCKWDSTQKRFINNGQSHWAANPGKLANSYHRSFTQKISEDTLGQIQLAIDKGAIIYDHYKGFHDRNSAVGKSQHMIAFSFSQTNEPTDGGTSHTWKHSKCPNKKHFTIQ